MRLRVLLLLAAAVVPAPAQQAFGWFRTRVEGWDWFEGAAKNDYAFNDSFLRIGLKDSRGKVNWLAEFMLPFLLRLPDNAIAPGAQGQLGLGATYFAANGSRNAAMLFLKQGYVRFHSDTGHSIEFGRMEFLDGNEVVPKNSTLAALKRDRISQRLIGNFGFTDVGRSFDGALYTHQSPGLNVTLLGARPTRGVYQVDGWGELNINVYYGALTGQVAGKNNPGEWRIFGLGYSDYRDGVLKTDNRPLGVRRADTEHINIGSFGGHYLQLAGPFDLLFWGVVQTGSWGRLAQRSGAFAAEAGWQPRRPVRLRPWIRGGYDYGSGDSDPNDNRHGTFFQVLPTARTYARFPFFNMMNLRDAFGELILRPYKALAIRADIHSLRLANRNDLWYLGGGAFQPWTFGYTGRPSNGQSGLATLYDGSVDYSFNTHVTLGLYYGYANGKLVAQSIYPAGKDAHFGFVELNYRF